MLSNARVMIYPMDSGIQVAGGLETKCVLSVNHNNNTKSRSTHTTTLKQMRVSIDNSLH